MKKILIDQTNYKTSLVSIEVSGEDAMNFLQGQTTNDIKLLNDGEFQLTTLLDKAGKVVSYFYLGLKNLQYYIFVEESLVEVTLERLEKFLISEDVCLKTLSCEPSLLLGALSFEHENGFKGMLYGQMACLSFDAYKEKQESKLLLKYQILSGFPDDKLFYIGKLINNTPFNLNGISYSKGCFLGQETASKIQTRRGASEFPVILYSNAKIKAEEKIFDNHDKNIGTFISQLEDGEQSLILASLKREYRVDKKKIVLKDGQEVVVSNIESIAKENINQLLFDEAIDYFHKDDNERAKKLLRILINLDETNEDAYESLGVILGREEKFEEAIELMRTLEEINPKSVMANTNMSLYQMRLGNIEEAESQKSKATLKSFQAFGDEADKKKKLAKKKEDEKKDIERRKKMFLEVLELDENDSMALNGLGEIYLSEKKYKEAKELYKKALKNNQKYSVAYLGLAKSLIALNEKDEAVDVLETGISIAAKNGDMMPANSMQALLLEFQ